MRLRLSKWWKFCAAKDRKICVNSASNLRDGCCIWAEWLTTVADGKKQSEKLIASGKGARPVSSDGGTAGRRSASRSTIAKKLPQARHTTIVSSPKSGYLASLQCEQVGTACVILGGGRERKEDSVDPAVGIVLHKKVGDAVSAGEPLATIHYNAETRAARARQLLEAELSDC